MLWQFGLVAMLLHSYKSIKFVSKEFSDLVITVISSLAESCPWWYLLLLDTRDHDFTTISVYHQL